MRFVLPVEEPKTVETKESTESPTVESTTENADVKTTTTSLPKDETPSETNDDSSFKEGEEKSKKGHSPAQQPEEHPYAKPKVTPRTTRRMSRMSKLPYDIFRTISCAATSWHFWIEIPLLTSWKWSKNPNVEPTHKQFLFNLRVTASLQQLRSSLLVSGTLRFRFIL
jgi:hypothetical protein